MVGTLFTAGALALLRGAGAAYVEYSTYENNDCVNVVSTSIYAGVPTMAGVQATDTCLEYVETTTTSILASSLTDGNGVLSLQHVCNTTESASNTTESTESGRLTNVWYSSDDCDVATVSYEFAQDVCTASCTADEPDFGSDEFEDLTITFYDSAACTNATGTEELTEADLYALFGVEDGTSCSPSGDFGFNTVIHCSDGSPAAVYYEDNACTGDIVGMTSNVGCAPVPSNGTFPGVSGGWFMAECVEGAVAAEEDDDPIEDEDEDVEGAGNGAVSSLALGLSSGVAAASIATVLAAFF